MAAGNNGFPNRLPRILDLAIISEHRAKQANADGFRTAAFPDQRGFESTERRRKGRRVERLGNADELPSPPIMNGPSPPCRLADRRWLRPKDKRRYSAANAITPAIAATPY